MLFICFRTFDSGGESKRLFHDRAEETVRAGGGGTKPEAGARGRWRAADDVGPHPVNG